MSSQLRIKGRITVYSEAANGGIIVGEDANAYIFSKKEWNSFKQLKADLEVIFTPGKDNIAKSIIAHDEAIN